MAKVIAIITHKGGSLKTSLTVNLAGVLSQQKVSKKRLARKNKILIIDLDGQGNSGMSFGFKPNMEFEKNIYDVLLDEEPIRNIIVQAHKNIDLAGSNKDMITFELTALMDNRLDRKDLFHMLKKAIEPIKDEYDYILIDTPPSLGLIAGNVFVATDDIIIPFHPESYSMESLVSILQQANSFKKSVNPKLKVLGIVGTRVDPRTNLHSDVLQEARKFAEKINLTFFDTVIPQSVRFANSVAYKKKPATLTDSKHPLVRSYFDLVKEMNLE